jgi:acetyl esterase/lipase
MTSPPGSPASPGRRRNAVRSWLAVILGAGALFVSAWIVLPPPAGFLLVLAAAAPEVSAWLGVVAALALLLARPRLRPDPVARVAAICALLALACVASVFARFPSTARAVAVALRGATGGDPLLLVPGEVRAAIRPAPLDVAQLFRGLPRVDALVDSDIPFDSAAASSLLLDIYHPMQRGRYPVVVQVHGGAWQQGSPHENEDFARRLTAMGYAVVSLDHRRAPEYQWPAQLQDIRAGLAWIRDHSGRYGFDTARVALLGRSSGAQLALLAAYAPGPLGIRAVVSYYGATDLTAVYRQPPFPDPAHVRTIEEALFGGPPEELAAVYRDASPIAHVRASVPPTLLLQGRRDNITEARWSRALRDSLRAAGATVAYLEIPWAGHGFDIVPNGPSGQLALYNVQRFLAWAMARDVGATTH